MALQGPEARPRRLRRPQVRLKFAPELVSPAAVFLAHESCVLNGEVLISGGGQVMRMAFVGNEGIAKDDMSPEDVAENLGTIMDLSDAQGGAPVRARGAALGSTRRRARDRRRRSR